MIIATAAEVERFLGEFRPAAERGKVVLHGTREKNLACRLRLGLTLRDVQMLLAALELSDYSQGPEPDNKGRQGVVWLFGPDYCGVALYVKLADWDPAAPRFHCVSFHEPESAPLPLP